jgi:hypothetical protein
MWGVVNYGSFAALWDDSDRSFQPFHDSGRPALLGLPTAVVSQQEIER